MYFIKFFICLVILVQQSNFLSAAEAKVSLDNVEIAIGEKDQLALNYEQVDYPTGLKKLLECDGNQKLSIKFSVRDLAQSKDLTVQQAAIHFVNEQTNNVIIYFVDQDRVSKVYSKDINLNYKGKEFNYQSGNYLIKVVIGDTTIESIQWTLGKLNIQFVNQEESTISNWLDRYLEKPEIVHQFREAEKRPPVIVSHAFTLLSLSPVLVLGICWSKIGVNLSKFRFSLSALCFHGSLILIFTLYTLFFIRLNMFTTLKCLSGIFVTAFISGHYLLKDLAGSSETRAAK